MSEEVIYVCAIKMLGFAFAVRTKEEADKWVEQDPESNYYNTVPIRTVP